MKMSLENILAEFEKSIKIPNGDIDFERIEKEPGQPTIKCRFVFQGDWVLSVTDLRDEYRVSLNFERVYREGYETSEISPIYNEITGALRFPKHEYNFIDSYRINHLLDNLLAAVMWLEDQ